MINFIGAITAIVTPFRGNLVDDSALSSLIDWQIKNGIDGIVVCGTTGESATVTDRERERIIRIAIDAAQGRVPVIAGAGSNDTSRAIELAKLASRAGADGQLQVTPYYNKPTQEGLYQHFRAIAEASDLPMILYNVPGRTGVNMKPETTIKLSKISSIVGIKEACGDIEQVKQIAAEKLSGFQIFSGEDAQNLEIYKAGGKGCISVASNIIPDKVSKIWDLFAEGKEKQAEELQRKIAPINTAMFFETNPIPVKTSLAMMGKCAEEFRLPMTKISAENRKKLEQVLKENGII